jgi:hypothetical protein
LQSELENVTKNEKFAVYLADMTHNIAALRLAATPRRPIEVAILFSFQVVHFLIFVTACAASAQCRVGFGLAGRLRVQFGPLSLHGWFRFF